MATTTTHANRGKSTEKKVEEFLKQLNKRSDTSYLRFPDARAARGALAAQVADFLVVSKGVPIFLEAKHLNHPRLLPKDKVSQHPVLRKFAEAGAVGLVLVEHEGLGWRVVNVLNMEFGVPSWNLAELVLHSTAEIALKSTGYF